MKEDAGGPRRVLSGTEIRQGRAGADAAVVGNNGGAQKFRHQFSGFFIPTDAFPPTYFLFLVLEGEAVNAVMSGDKGKVGASKCLRFHSAPVS